MDRLTMHRQSTYRWIAPVLALVLLAGCEREGSDIPTMADVRADEGPVQESWDVRFQVSQSPSHEGPSRPRLEIHAGYMATFERPDSTYTLMRPASDTARTPVRAVLFDEAGDTSAVVTAQRMIYFEEERRFEARGDVDVVTPEGRRLQSEELFWDEIERKVRTPGFTRIQTPTEQLQGYELEADENLDNYALARVTGQVLVEEE